MSRYDEMLKYMPLYYQASGIFKSILAVEGSEMDLLRAGIEDLKAQCYVDKATWGLDLWESEYGIGNNSELTDEERKSQLKGKMRGVGKVDSQLLDSIATAYSNGEVDVKYGDTCITVKFIGTRGIPSAIEALKQQLSEVMPAHLAVNFIFTYLIWNEFDLLNAQQQESMTWDALEIFKP